MSPLQLDNKADRATKSQKHEISRRPVYHLFNFCVLWCFSAFVAKKKEAFKFKDRNDE